MRAGSIYSSRNSRKRSRLSRAVNSLHRQQYVVEQRLKHYKVTLGTRKQRLYSRALSGTTFDATVVGWYVPGALVVRNEENGEHFTVKEEFVEGRVSASVLSTKDHPECRYKVGETVPFTIADSIYDVEGTLISGRTVRSTVDHVIYDIPTDECWYVLRLQYPYCDVWNNNGDNWWCGYDVRRESDVK
jgi:hypothetical protein